MYVHICGNDVRVVDYMNALRQKTRTRAYIHYIRRSSGVRESRLSCKSLWTYEKGCGSYFWISCRLVSSDIWMRNISRFFAIKLAMFSFSRRRPWNIRSCWGLPLRPIREVVILLLWIMPVREGLVFCHILRFFCLSCSSFFILFSRSLRRKTSSLGRVKGFSTLLMSKSSPGCSDKRKNAAGNQYSLCEHISTVNTCHAFHDAFSWRAFNSTQIIYTTSESTTRRLMI